MMEKANHYMIYMYTFIKILVENTMEKFSQAKNELILGIKNKDLQFNAWFVVLLAAILVFATASVAGLTIWCVVNQHGKFTGNWNWHIKGVSLDVECKR
jgi:hypothetical protein